MIQVAIVFDTQPDGQVRIDEQVEYHTPDNASVALAIDVAVKRATARAMGALNRDA